MRKPPQTEENWREKRINQRKENIWPILLFVSIMLLQLGVFIWVEFSW